MKESSIGETISFYRKQNGFTQNQLAEKIGISAGAVSKWENHASLPDISLLKPLARALKINVDTLLNYQQSLSDAEVEEVRSKSVIAFSQKGYQAGKEVLKEKLLSYPENSRLKMMAATTMKMYLFTGLDIVKKESTEDFVKKENEGIRNLYLQVVNEGDSIYRSTALFALAGLALENENYHGAEEYLKELKDRYVDPFPLYATLWLKQKEYQQAELLSKEMLLHYLTLSSSMLITLSKVSAQQKNSEKAVFYLSSAQWIEECFSVGMASASLHKARLYVQMNNLQEGAKSFLQYVEKLIATEYAYSSHSYFEGIELQAKPQEQKRIRESLYQHLLAEEEWHVLVSQEEYQKARELLAAELSKEKNSL
ncbi:MAG: helix-turn-helix domain-containing protein [Clostridiales bacterium]|nr:helix-turn-helix domain-containing protein [Clostridiales bacterium]